MKSNLTKDQISKLKTAKKNMKEFFVKLGKFMSEIQKEIKKYIKDKDLKDKVLFLYDKIVIDYYKLKDDIKAVESGNKSFLKASQDPDSYIIVNYDQALQIFSGYYTRMKSINDNLLALQKNVNDYLAGALSKEELMTGTRKKYKDIEQFLNKCGYKKI